MARYTGPKTKIARKFGEPIYGADKNYEKRNYPPGQHGAAKRRKKVSDQYRGFSQDESLPGRTAFAGRA